MTVWVNKNEGRQVVAMRGPVRKDGGMMPTDGEVEIEVESTDPTATISALRVLLANAVSLYLRAHGFHWNVRGADFAQYHALFEAIYSDVYDSVDPIAENVLKLGGVAPFRLPELMALRTIVDSPVASPMPADLAADLLAANDTMIASLRVAFECAESIDEQGIANFIAERIDAHEKWRWQLSASLA